MNFLAHVHLSHGIVPVIMGNLVADAYKGSKHNSLPPAIQHGVILHRKIDHITDSFKGVLEMKKVLSPYFGRYAGIALDVYFDHFLSLHWDRFNKMKLFETISVIHASLTEYLPMVNDEAKLFIERLIQYKWLASYHEKDDLHRIFKQMSGRFRLDVLKNSILPLEKHFLEIEATFNDLYPLLIEESHGYVVRQRL